MEHEDKLFTCKILILIFFVINNFVLSFFFSIIKENNLILGSFVSRFLKIGALRLLKMEFL